MNKPTMSPEYVFALRRCNDLEALRPFLTTSERAEWERLRAQLEAAELAHDRRMGEAHDAAAIATFQGICTDYEYLLSLGDYGGTEI